MRSLKIFGAPGCGKTYTLLKYFEEELKGTKPERIGFVTFTRAARAEALSRTKLTEEELPYVKTLHSTCYRALKIDQNQLVVRKDLIDFGKSIGVHLTGFMPDLFALEAITERFQQPTKADRLLQLNHLGRHRGLKLRETLKDAPLELDYRYAKWFTQSYRDWKTASGKSDYTDLLVDYLDHGEVLDLDVLFVDEAQDLSWLQWAVVRKLSQRCKKLYICGDDDQCIFSWAGASSSMFLLEPTDDFQVLPQSYRLPRVVHELSQKVIHRVKVRQEKEFRPREYEGEYRPIGRLDLSYLQQGSTLILYRNFHRGTALSLQLEDLGVPYNGPNSVLSNQDVRSALQGWKKLQDNQPLSMGEAKAFADFTSNRLLAPDFRSKLEPKTGEISATAFLKPEAFNKPVYDVLVKLPRLSYIARTLAHRQIEEVLNPNIGLLSIHQSKGREANTVILDLELARRTYEAYMREPDDEHRVYYVAVTRAKERLLTLLASDSMSYQL